MPFNLSLVPLQAIFIVLGGGCAILMVLIYSVLFANPQVFSEAISSLIAYRNKFIFEALVISFFVGGSFIVAQLMKLENSYWVPISCAAIMQGSTFTAVWHRKIHRIVGTILGLGVTWLIFLFSPSAIELGFLIIILNFLIEFFVVRNYALAVIFITPVTIIFAESTTVSISSNALVAARLTDIIVGCLIGLVGGWLLHHPKFFMNLKN
jgi:uncharacterized membrane protein YccC